jgi:streptomycin 6-kinase
VTYDRDAASTAQLLHHYAEMWGLTELVPVGDMSVNLVYYCYAKHYGEAVLKISASSDWPLTMEINTLHEYSSDARYVNLFETDESGCALLLERIVPGDMLKDETSLDTRLDVFIGLVSGLHKAPVNPTIYPTYLNWIDDAADFMRTNESNPQLRTDIQMAQKLCIELFSLSKKRVLLHGDLHYANILRNTSGGYTIIDPKGVIGPAYFDLPRYILNELSPVKDSQLCLNIMNHIISRFENELCVSRQDLIKLYFVERVLASVWLSESNLPMDDRKVLFAEELLKRTI